MSDELSPVRMVYELLKDHMRSEDEQFDKLHEAITRIETQLVPRVTTLEVRQKIIWGILALALTTAVGAAAEIMLR